MDDKSTQGLFTERDLTLVENCQVYAAGNPGRLPGHALMLVVAKIARLVNHMATLLTPEEIQECMAFFVGSPPTRWRDGVRAAGSRGSQNVP